MAALTQAKAKTAQRALIVMFFVQGFSATTFVPRIPELIAQLHVNFVIWGSVIGLSGLGSLLPLIFTNHLVARYGTRPVIRVAAAFISLFVVLIPWSTNIWVFFAMQAL